MIFKNYARYYDLLYKDKDYSKEISFIHNLLCQYNPGAKDILELGCGTGVHSVFLAKKGYQVHGIDFSEHMLESAYERLNRLPKSFKSKLQYTNGDIRKIRIGRKFDAVLSLFHVMSYQTTNEDLLSTFATAKEHLKPDGIFIFDCWYGPAVLSNRPNTRIKRLKDDKIDVIRFAEPTMHPNENIVDVKYQVLIKSKDGDKIDELHETHKMRYLFKTEIEYLSSQSGFDILVCSEWMSKRPIGFETWNSYFILRPRNFV